MTKPTQKFLSIRVEDDLHRRAKLQAYKEGKSIQEWIANLVENKLKDKRSTCIRLCEACGKWNLKGTQMAMIGKCENCGNDEIAVYPCWEKK